MKKWLAFLFFAFVCFANAYSQRAAILDDDLSELWINKTRSYILEDPSCSFTIDSVQQKTFASVTSDNPQNDNLASDYWIKFLVLDRREENKDLRLELYDFDLDEITFYQQDENGSYVAHEAGYALPFNVRQISHKNVSFHISEVYNDSAYFYMKFHSAKHNLLKPVIRPYDVVMQYALKEYILFGIFYGLLLLMIFYHLLYYSFLNSSSSLYYVLYTSFVLLFFLAENGTGFQYIWPNLPVINPYIGSFSLIASEITLLLFTQSFLELKEKHPQLNKLINSLLLIRIVAGVFQLALTQSNQWEIINLLFVQIVLGIGIASWRKGNTVARWFVFAFCTLNIAFLITFLERISFISSSIFTVYAFYLGVLGQFVFLSISIVGAVKETYDQRDEAQRELIVELEKNEALREKVNRELEAKVAQRTQELATQKELVEQKNEKIISSFRYAKTIQSAVLPTQEYMQQVLSAHFSIYMPKDIVSGDFYWVHQVNADEYLIAAVDCTGHGVPGAFMSMIGINLLNQIVASGITQPDEMLSYLHQSVQVVLKQKSSRNQDGMDMALCRVHKKNKTIQFAGAKNPLVYIQNGVIQKIRGSKHAIGGAQQAEKLDYELHELSFAHAPIAFYLFSDGYVDQFGGPNNKKFYTKNLLQLLEDSQDKSLAEQKRLLVETILNWMGRTQNQIDDILVLGVQEG